MSSESGFVEKIVPLSRFAELAVNRLLPDSPNILPLSGLRISSDKIALKLPLCESRRQILTEEAWFTNLRQLVSGLSVLESVGIFHSDVRPANILFYQGQHVLIDFGASRPIDSYIYPWRNHTRSMYLHNLAPEMVQGKSYSSEVDMWALGITMLEWRGISPLTALSYDKLMEQQITHFSRGHVFEGKWPEASGFLSALLEFDPQQRLSLERARYFLNLPEVTVSRINNDQIVSHLLKYTSDIELINLVQVGLREWYKIIKDLTPEMTSKLKDLIIKTQGQLFPNVLN